MFKVDFTKDNSVQYNCRIGIETYEVRQPSLTDSFHYQNHESPRDSIGNSVAICNPLYMLFNQQRLDRLGPNAVQAWLRTMKESGHSSVNELRKKVSDEDLLAIIKPKDIQSPCELESWLNMLNERVDLFNSELARITAEKESVNAMEDSDAPNKVESQIK